MNNIFALSTAAGKSGVAIVRVSGAGADAALSSLQIDPQLEPRKAFLRSLCKDNGDIIDKALVMRFPAPASYTGQNMVEFHIHGGRAIIQDLLCHLASLPDFRYAEAGEFSHIAFENGKMDLTQLEGVADLIDAETSAQRKQAFRQMDGQLGQLYDDWRNKIITILAHIEAYIDFPDEDIPSDILDEIIADVDGLRALLKTHLTNKRGEIVRSGLYVTIIGAPNVGKSSLINLLAQRDIAIVSNIAGTTRDIIEAHIEIAGLPVTLADSAGLRNSEDVIENLGIEKAAQNALNSDIKICVFDVGNISDGDQKGKINSQISQLIDKNTIVICNKMDLLEIESSHSDGNGNRTQQINGQNIQYISTKTGQNVDELLSLLADKITQIAPESADPVLTRERHRASVESALSHLQKFKENIENKVDLELCSEDLRIAAQHLGQVTGAIGVEDLLDKIFSSFCIGK